MALKQMFHSKPEGKNQRSNKHKENVGQARIFPLALFSPEDTKE